MLDVSWAGSGWPDSECLMFLSDIQRQRTISWKVFFFPPGPIGQGERLRRSLAFSEAYPLS